MISEKLHNLAYLCRCQEELVGSVLEMMKYHSDISILDPDDCLFCLKKTEKRWMIINYADKKVVAWVKCGKGDFARLMSKWIQICGYDTF